jgi:hypothetical protein
VKITVIATGFDKKPEPSVVAAALAAAAPLPSTKSAQPMPDLEIPTFLRRQR